MEEKDKWKILLRISRNVKCFGKMGASYSKYKDYCKERNSIKS